MRHAEKHWEHDGRPYCGAVAQGAFVVEVWRAVTCAWCRARMWSGGGRISRAVH